jgi:predicted nucleic acid-binding protein
MFRAAVEQEIPLVTTNLVLAEVHRFVLFRNGPRAAAAMLARIEASTLLSVEFETPALHATALGWLDRLANHRISYTDAVSFAIMNASRCSMALGFDNDFVVAGFQLWRP